MNGLIRYNPKKDVYEIVSQNSPSAVLTKSKRLSHLDYLVRKQKNDQIVAAGITTYQVVSVRPGETEAAPSTTVPEAVVSSAVSSYVDPIDTMFSIDEKFELMDELLDMVIAKEADGMIIAGRGGIGKTFGCMARFNAAGKIDVADVMPSIEDLKAAEINPEDTEETMEQKAYLEINRPKGDYVVVKGRATPKALYRILFENRKRHIIFDDCDSILENGDCADLLKTALDTYEKRIVSWRSESAFGDDSLPQSFKFEGAIIFITNKNLGEIDEAVRTRCFKVNVAMSTDQRIDRMRKVLPAVMPDISMDLKVDALGVLEEVKDMTDNINFRSLMQTITIRNGSSNHWKTLAKYSLLVK